MLKFHALPVRDVQPESDDAVALTFDVPDSLREEFRSQPGQHVVVRTFMNGEEVRRTYSLTNAAGELPLQIVVRTHPSGKLSRHLASLTRTGTDPAVFVHRCMRCALISARLARCGTCFEDNAGQIRVVVGVA